VQIPIEVRCSNHIITTATTNSDLMAYTLLARLQPWTVFNLWP
jgi:hypothetical protein